MSEPVITGRAIADAMQVEHRYYDGVVQLARRGLSKQLVTDLVNSGSAARTQVDLLLERTAPPPRRSWPAARWLRIKVRLGAADPDAEQRARAARFVEQINRVG